MSEIVPNWDVDFSPMCIPRALADLAFDILNKAPYYTSLRNVTTNVVQKIKRGMIHVGPSPDSYFYDKFELPTFGWDEPWAAVLKDIRDTLLCTSIWDKGKLEHCKHPMYNAVLLNRYENGRDTIMWHSDKEKQIGETPFICCVNLGAGRKFHFRKIEDQNQTTYYPVQHGDVLTMLPMCQKRWQHAILPEPEVDKTRISLTFRYLYENIV